MRIAVTDVIRDGYGFAADAVRRSTATSSGGRAILAG